MRLRLIDCYDPDPQAVAPSRASKFVRRVRHVHHGVRWGSPNEPQPSVMLTVINEHESGFSLFLTPDEARSLGMRMIEHADDVLLATRHDDYQG